ncbi:MAG: hypothetical protein Q8Q04_00850 [archaeon]|nr:hypothetical protein [archaeon]
MEDPVSMYLFVSLLAFLGISILAFLIKKNQKEREISFLEGLAFIFILVGIVFGEQKILGYSLISAGIVFVIGDIYVRIKKKASFD